MTVGELIVALERVDRNAVLVAGGEVLSGFEVVSGRIGEGHYNDRFSAGIAPHKAKHVGVWFTRWGAESTGDVVELRI